MAKAPIPGQQQDDTHTRDIKANLAGLGGKVDKNPSIIPGTATKISYDSKGLVIAGTQATAADIFAVPRAVTVDTLAAIGEFLSVTCSTVDIEVLLPDATLTPGASIWIHKVDATAFKVLTSVKDIKYKRSTMHLISNGADWVIS